MQFKIRRKKTLYGGTYFDSKLKKEYEAKLKLKDVNTIKFTLKYGLFNKKAIWHRVQ